MIVQQGCEVRLYFKKNKLPFGRAVRHQTLEKIGQYIGNNTLQNVPKSAKHQISSNMAKKSKIYEFGMIKNYPFSQIILMVIILTTDQKIYVFCVQTVILRQRLIVVNAVLSEIFNISKCVETIQHRPKFIKNMVETQSRLQLDCYSRLQ